MSAVRLHAVQTHSKVLLPPFAQRAAPVYFVVLHGFLAHSGAMNSFVVMLRNALDALNRSVLETNDANSTVLPFHITTLDARNHGLSPHTPTHVLGSLVDDLNNYLTHDHPATVRTVSEDLGFASEPKARVMAIGHSMGSMTWTQFLMDRHAAAATPSSQTSSVDVCGLVSMDMPPITQAHMSASLVAELTDIIDVMKKVDLTRISDLRSAHEEFIRCGMTDIRARGLCTTNMALTVDPSNPGRQVAKWKCNVPVLEHSIRTGALFFTDAYMKRPLSSCNTAQERVEEATADPSVGNVPVLSILGGASPIGGNAVYHDVWERYAVKLDQRSIDDATHTVYYDKPRETIDLVKAFLEDLNIL